MSIIKIENYSQAGNDLIRHKFQAIKSMLDELRESGYCHCFEIKKGSQVVDRVYKIFPKAKVLDEVEDKFMSYGDLKEEYRAEYRAIEKGSYKVNVFKVGEFDYFDELFKKEFNIPFHKMNQDSVRRLLGEKSREEVVEYLRDTYTKISENKKVRNVGALFTKKIFNGEIQVNPVVSKSTRKKIAGVVNYYLDMAKVAVSRKEVEQRLREELKKFPSELRKEYIKKFKEHVENI